MRYEEYAACTEWWGGPEREGRREGDRAWIVKIDQIAENDYNLNIVNPTTDADFTLHPPIEIIKEMISIENEITMTLASLLAEFEAGA
jgi:type I restriction enzyme M protein